MLKPEHKICSEQRGKTMYVLMGGEDVACINSHPLFTRLFEIIKIVDGACSESRKKKETKRNEKASDWFIKSFKNNLDFYALVEDILEKNLQFL